MPAVTPAEVTKRPEVTKMAAGSTATSGKRAARCLASFQWVAARMAVRAGRSPPAGTRRRRSRRRAGRAAPACGPRRRVRGRRCWPASPARRAPAACRWCSGTASARRVDAEADARTGDHVAPGGRRGGELVAAAEGVGRGKRVHGPGRVERLDAVVEHHDDAMGALLRHRGFRVYNVWLSWPLEHGPPLDRQSSHATRREQS